MNSLATNGLIDLDREKTRRHLSPTSIKRFCCEHPGCGKAFTRQDHLIRHKLNHNPDTIFSCQQCSKIFVREDLLLRHEQRHARKRARNTSGHKLTHEQAQHEDSVNISQSQAHLETQQDHSPPLNQHPSYFTCESLENPSIGGNTDPMLNSTTFMDIPHAPNLEGFSSIPTFGGDAFMEANRSFSVADEFTTWLFDEPTLNYTTNSQYTSINPPSPVSAFNFPIPIVKIETRKLEELLSVLPVELQSDPLFTSQNIIYAIQHYFIHYYPSYPVLHLPTFSVADTPPLLLWSIIALGSFFTTDDDFGRPFYEIMPRLVNSVRLTVFGVDEFHPPASLWVLQTLLFIEVFEKSCAGRNSHEKADIFHTSTITLMRRGSSLIQPAPTSEQHSTSGKDYKTDTDRKWREWVTNESTKRCAYFAFVIDTAHAIIFGHSQAMTTSEILLTLPCSDSMWNALDASAWNAIQKPKELVFLTAIKQLLAIPSSQKSAAPVFPDDNPAPTLPPPNFAGQSSFGKTILLYGLASIALHVKHKVFSNSSSVEVGEESSVQVSGPFPFGLNQHKVELGGKANWIRAISTGFEAWNSIFNAPDRNSYQVASLFTQLYHRVNMTIYSDVVDLRIFAGEQRLLGRPISKSDYTNSCRKVMDWARNDFSNTALQHAIKVLKDTITPEYKAKNDGILTRAWNVFTAVLICWSYGYALEGESDPVDLEDRWEDMHDYFHSFDIPPHDFPKVRRKNRTQGLLMVVQQDVFPGCRFQLITEASNLLAICESRVKGNLFLD